MKLQTLSLDGHPAHDVMGGTLAAWVEAICTNRDFNEKDDAPRFRRAFATLMQREVRWPSPSRFLEALPSNVTPFRKPKLLESEKTRTARMESFEAIRKRLNMRTPDDDGPEAA